MTRMMLSTPEATASSTPSLNDRLVDERQHFFGCALVAGRKRVPRPAAGKTALRTMGGHEADRSRTFGVRGHYNQAR